MFPRAEDFRDPADTVSCDPVYPKDSPEDIFRDCMILEQRSDLPVAFPKAVAEEFALRAFRRFMAEWRQIEDIPTHVSGEEGAVALLQTMTKSKTRETALTAYCYLLAIGRTPLSQVDVARLFWGETEGDKHRATVNARVIAIRDDLGLGKARGMKRDAARLSYAVRATRIHDKRKKQTNKLWKKPLPSLVIQALSCAA
jgi:hypothetical protein